MVIALDGADNKTASQLVHQQEMYPVAKLNEWQLESITDVASESL